MHGLFPMGKTNEISFNLCVEFSYHQKTLPSLWSLLDQLKGFWFLERSKFCVLLCHNLLWSSKSVGATLSKIATWEFIVNSNSTYTRKFKSSIFEMHLAIFCLIVRSLTSYEWELKIWSLSIGTMTWSFVLASFVRGGIAIDI